MTDFDRVVLRKDGLYGERWEKKKINKVYLLPTSLVWASIWQLSFEIQGRVLFKDFVKYLQRLDQQESLSMLEELSGSNIRSYLTKENLESKRNLKERKLHWIEVYKTYELTNQHDLKIWELSGGHVCAHGIGLHQGKVSPLAIEMEPWGELLSVPLRVAEKASFMKIVYVKDKLRTMGFVKEGETKAAKGTSWTTDKKLLKQEQQEVQVSYTVSDFFRGLFNELSFFASPTQRDERKVELFRRYDETKEAKENGSKNFYVLKEIKKGKKHATSRRSTAPRSRDAKDV